MEGNRRIGRNPAGRGAGWPVAMAVLAVLPAAVPARVRASGAPEAQAQPAAAGATAPGPAAPVVTPPAPAATAKPDAVPLARAAEGIAIGPGGYLRLGLLLQAWYQARGVADTVSAPGATRDTWTNSLRLRRAEIHLRGELLPKRLAYGLMVDPAKLWEAKDATVTVDVPVPDGLLPKDADGHLLGADGKPILDADGNPVDSLTGTAKVKQGPSPFGILQDFWIGVLTDYADVSVGQFKIPVSWEGFNSSGALIFAERALVSSAFGDKRDLGIKIDKRFKHFYYHLALFNGAGANTFDFDHRKDLAARVEVTPLPWLMLGGVAYASLRPAGKDAGARDRFEADVRLDTHGVLFQAEYLYARDWDAAAGRLVPGQGVYAALAYSPVPQWQVAARFGWLDEDVDDRDAKRTEVWEAGAGLHWMALGHQANLKLDWFFFKPDKATAKWKGTEHQLVLAGQVRF